jgi:hypothetical protein
VQSTFNNPIYEANSFKWVQPIIKNSCLISVSGIVLPVPIHLPPDVGVDRQALISSSTDHPEANPSAEIFFDNAQEGQIVKWLEPIS